MWTFEGDYHVHHGDCIEHMAALPAAVFDMAVYSPPFPSVYAYTSSDRDIGNSEDLRGDAKLHLSFFFRQFARLLKPGRVAVAHVQQIPRMKRAGGRGLHDFRGLCIRLGERAGLTFEYDWLVRKNPQAQAIRGKAWELKFQGVETDRSMSRGTLCDYLLKFRAPGENAVPIDSAGQVSRNDWIKWAEGAWFDIREADTLNGQKGLKAARGESDTKHICPLQLEVIERLVRLYSNPGEIVFSPFAGIGSELVTALRLGRRAYGCELKDEYHAEAVRNCAAVVQWQAEQPGLFDDMAEEVCL
ncbi:MAG: DNA-methyltransferase [Gemmata sp.]